jgi:hypothetical protein
MPGEGWTAKLATAAWVEDIIRDKIIDGPYRVAKKGSPGRGSRFHPRDYRDLLRIIKLKAQGINHRAAWKAHLWLRGRNYPIGEVRAAFRETQSTLAEKALLDFAPRGRLETRDPFSFSKRYDRRVRQRPDGLLFPELIDILEIAIAFGIDPKLVARTNVDPERIVRELARQTHYPASKLRPAIPELIGAIKHKRPLSALAEQQLRDFGNSKIPQALQDAFLTAPALKDFEGVLSSIGGLIGSFSKPPAPIESFDVADEERWLKVRFFFQGICSGRLEALLRAALSEAPESSRELLRFMLNSTQKQREFALSAPWAKIQTFSGLLHSSVRWHANHNAEQ